MWQPGGTATSAAMPFGERIPENLGSEGIVCVFCGRLVGYRVFRLAVDPRVVEGLLALRRRRQRLRLRVLWNNGLSPKPSRRKADRKPFPLGQTRPGARLRDVNLLPGHWRAHAIHGYVEAHVEKPAIGRHEPKTKATVKLSATEFGDAALSL